MSIGVVGSRGFTDYNLVCRTLRCMHGLECLVSGGAGGADTLAEQWAAEYNVGITVIPVTPQEWKQYGRSAGPRRNRKIVLQSDWIVAFWDGVSPGTKSTIDIAKNLGVPVTIIRY